MYGRRMRIRLAIHRYQAEGISLAKAASLAGVSWAQMKDILIEYGVEPCLGPETVEEAQEEVAVLRDYLESAQARVEQAGSGLSLRVARQRDRHGLERH